MPDARPWRLLSPPVIGWVLYDFANTIFSFVVVTRYFNDWIVEERGQPDVLVGLMTAAVSLALLLALPLTGAWVDRTGRHKPVLVAFSLTCVTATALLGVVGPVALALVVGAIATFSFNLADSQYHPLLHVVAPEPRRGRVSGIGVGVGFVGSMVALILLGVMVDDGEAQTAFLPAAALVAVFAIPCYLLVRDRPRTPEQETAARARLRVPPFAQLRASVRRVRGTPQGRLMLARFLYVDAIATALQFLTVYARRTGEFDGDDIDLLLAISIVFAIVGAVGGGLLAERIGPRRVILGVLALTIGSLLAVAATGSGALLWVGGPLIGVALGCLSAVDRVFLLRLVSEDRRGEDFALFALVGKLSSGFGPLVLWGGTVLVATEVAGLSQFTASRIAVAVLAGAAVAGFLVLRPLRDQPAKSPGYVRA